MNGICVRPPRYTLARINRGSILIYVLWILVVISVLAFQLTSASRITTLSQSAFANQLKSQMQLDSAIQFGLFKIRTNAWRDRTFELKLNSQSIGIEIYNESGFFSIYEMSSKSLKKAFDFVSVDSTTVEEIEQAVLEDSPPQRFNSFNELGQFSNIDDEVLKKLIPLISIYHESPANPNYSPAEVLMQFSRVDKYRVQKLMQSSDQAEKVQLRKEIIESLLEQNIESDEDISFYYRLHVSIGNLLHRVFVKYDRRRKKYIVVLINSIESDLKVQDS